ncbi:MAG: hypothetical protein KC435_02555 [Thermomicrobiales bacterium]|nr:hypothetical protein [Thermomicrobiales bacterium]
MNTESTLTAPAIEEICARHNISYHSHSRIGAGFTHEVHRLNDNLVIKLFNTTNPKNYQTELALLQADLEVRRPSLVANHDSTSLQDRSYIITTFVDGQPLGSRWHMATDKQREQLISDISTTLAEINRIDPSAIGTASESWQTIIEDRISSLSSMLLSRGTVTDLHARKIRTTVERSRSSLEDSDLHPVYWDIHFDNFLVNDKFELLAITDLESVDLVALDYPLFVVEKLMDEPHKYLREEDEKYANVEDYAQLKDWYRRYYPEMFAFDRQEERIKLYLLIDTLHLLTDWSHVRDLYDKLDKLTRE